MKKISAILVSLVVCGCGAAAYAALDTAATYHDSVIPAQSTTLIQTNVVLIAPGATTNNSSVTSGATKDISAYPGTGLLSVGFGTGIDASYTGTVTVIFSTDTTVEQTNTFTHTGTTAGQIYSIEVDFDTLQGTNAYLYVTGVYSVVCGEAEDTYAAASAQLTVGAARGAAQSITGSAVDTINYKGFGTIVVDVGTPLNGSAAYTNVVTIQHGVASTGAWTTVSSVTNTAADVDEISYEFGKGGRYIRALVSTTNDAGPVSVTLNAFK